MVRRWATVACLLLLMVGATIVPAAAAPRGPALTLRTSSAAVTVGRAVTFEGKIVRHVPGQRLRLQRKSASGWTTLTTRTLPRTSKTRAYRFRVRLDRPGRQRFRTVLVRKGKTRAVLSRTVVVSAVRPDSGAPRPEPTPPPTPPAPGRLQQVPVGDYGVDGVGSSADGRWVVFRSFSPSLVAGDDNETSDVFLADMNTGAVVLVSRAVDGGSGDAASFQSAISDDGNWIVFASDASDLVRGDTNGTRDVFLWNRVTRSITLVSQGAGGVPADGWSGSPDVSDGGSVVVFSSMADNLVPHSTPKATELFAWRRDTGVITRVSDREPGVPLSSELADLGVSAGGDAVVFTAGRSWDRQIYLRSLSSDELTVVPVPEFAAAHDPQVSRPVLSSDGQHVAYVVTGSDGQPVVGVWDVSTNTSTLVSVRPDGTLPTQGVTQPSISADGRWIAFQTADGGLVEGDENGRRDVFVWDRESGRSALVSAPTERKPATEEASNAVVSGDGTYVFFESQEPFAVVGKSESLYRWARSFAG